jgi:dipeptidyl aminopeptidase/acylaminoacyl peptidase
MKMKIEISKLIIVPAALVCSIALFASRADAQQTATTVAEAHHSGPHGASTAYSPDGLRIAHWGNEYPTVLYLKTQNTSEESAVLRSGSLHKDWLVVNGLAFSPDGERLIFEASPPRQFVGSIYITSLDGKDLKELASDKQGFPDPTDPTGKSIHDVGISKPLFSPDGRQVLVEVTETDGKRDDQGRFNDKSARIFVAVISSSGEEQIPEKLAEGKPLFWSADGNAIFYLGKDWFYHRIDPATKQDDVLTDARDTFILGRIPGTDTVFMRQRDTDKFATAVNLDGTTPSQQLKDLASSLSLKDPQGRTLVSARDAGAHQLMLTYNLPPSPTASVPITKTEIIKLN